MLRLHPDSVITQLNSAAAAANDDDNYSHYSGSCMSHSAILSPELLHLGVVLFVKRPRNYRMRRVDVLSSPNRTRLLEPMHCYKETLMLRSVAREMHLHSDAKNGGAQKVLQIDNTGKSFCKLWF